MDTRQLETLLAIVEQGTFAKAAQVVNLTASAVSQQIATLEQELGTTLFDRSTRPPTLNAQGAQLLQAAKNIVQIMDDTRAAISGASVTGTLNVGSVRTAAHALLPRALADLSRDYAGLKFLLHVGFSEGLMNDVVSGRLDVAVVVEHVGVPASLRWTPFVREPLVWIAPPGTAPLPEAFWLEAQPFIRYTSSVPLANQINTELARLGLSPREIAAVDTIPAVVECVKAGLGVAVVPLTALVGSERNELPWLPFGNPPISRQIGTVQRMTSSRSELIAALHAGLTLHASSFRAG